MNILVCDDHAVFAESLACLLTKGGGEVTVTHDLDQALHTLASEPVEIAIIDVMFGADSALDALPAIRRASPTTRLILLTARLDSATVSAGRAAGVAGFADKRQPSHRILSLIERVATGETVAPGIYPPRSGPPEPVRAAHRLAGHLTARERQVLGLLVTGHHTESLARILGVSVTTARSHVQSILTKLHVHTRLEAATAAVRHGIVDPQTGRWLI